MSLHKIYRLPLRIVFYKDHDYWMAHCLEFDLAGDGKTRSEALLVLTEAIAVQASYSFENNNPANLFSPAEGRFFEMYAAGHEIAEGMLEVVTSLERLQSSSPFITGLEAREYGEDECHEFDHQLALA